MAVIQPLEKPYDEYGRTPVGVPSDALTTDEHNWLFGPPVRGEYSQPGELTSRPLSGETEPLKPATPVPGSAAA